jgi:hypothetical protein
MNNGPLEKNTPTQGHAHTLEGGVYYGTHSEPENKFLTIRLTDHDFSRLNDLALRYGTNRTAMIRALLKNLIPE